MKYQITGPRSGLTDDGKLPWMHLEVDLPATPVRGQILILNDGGSYVVQNVLDWIDTDDQAWVEWGKDIEGTAHRKEGHVQVDTDYTWLGQLSPVERVAVREAAMAELAQIREAILRLEPGKQGAQRCWLSRKRSMAALTLRELDDIDLQTRERDL